MSLFVGFRFLVSRGPSNVGVVQLRFRRRTVSPPPWVPRKFKPIHDQLYKPDRALIEQELGSDSFVHSRKLSLSPYETFHLIPGVPNPPDCTQNQYSFEASKRIGLIGRKIGMTLQWLKDGTRCLCTLIHVPVNHVLSANDPETWYRHSLTGKQKAFRGILTIDQCAPPMWSQMVGVEDYDSPFLTNEYRALFERAGVPCKKFLAGFMVSGDAVVKPGTRLDVRHFKPGQWITASGRTIDWGFQGVMHRWGMKGQMRLHKGPTKAHRRVGAIGTKGEAMVWPGRCLPGHMGYEWRKMVGIKVLRINPIKQVIYVRGNVPGDINEWILLKDCFAKKKRVEEPPFPTFYPTEEDEEEMRMLSGQDNLFTMVSKDMYDSTAHQFSQPSVLYTEADETKRTERDRSRAKTAKELAECDEARGIHGEHSESEGGVYDVHYLIKYGESMGKLKKLFAEWTGVR
ncbi:hypothetical protein niasHT_038024 [Heterodera trifolii]|uniref:Large ribosomal subunit protein uL3m n=1 Tax=Heterodera trifolii TaxID=157864 RepID=A0ABD2HNH8_9BILA